MALVVKDRVQELTTTSGTGTLTLNGAVPGFQSFTTIGNNTTFYTIYDNIAQAWEVGLGTVTTGSPNQLARTTVLANSNGTTTAIPLVGNSSSVFVTYPAEKSVNLDASGNVSPLGTIASGTWQGTTVGVAYGGTGVTSSSGINSVVLRDANSNITANNVLAGYAATVSTASTTVLTAASAYIQRLTGSTTQTFQLPDATTLPNGAAFIFDNDAGGLLTIVNNASATVDTVPSGGADFIYLISNSTTAGTWTKYAFLPGEFDFSATNASFNNATITNAVWNGTAIAAGYGGTGLTTFGSSNYALYSTAPNALTAGTLPVAAGGTGLTSLTAGYVPYGNGTNAFSNSSTFTYNGTTVTAPAFAANATITGSLNAGAFSYGTLGYSDSNIFASFTSSVNSYNQIILQNTNSGNAASTDFIVSNNLATSAAYFGDFGINSSGFSGTGALGAANNVYLYSQGTDLAIGTGSSNSIHFVTNANSADAITVNPSNAVAFNGSYGTSGYILQSNGSGTSPTWVANSAGGASYTVTDFTATASQTVFTVSYVVGQVEVYRNGVRLAKADFTATNGTSITLTNAANAGDIIEVVAFNTTNTSATIAYDDFSGTGSQTVFTMTQTPANSASVIIAISGVVQDPSNYTVSGTTLTFSTAPPSGTNNISCRYLGLPTTTQGTASVLNATNGIIVNNKTITASYTIPSGSNALSTGPVQVSSGVVVTVPSGSRWAVI